MPIAQTHRMESLAALGFSAAALAGFTGSLHCFAMCGPLACASCARSTSAKRWESMGAYHGARIVAYTVIGALFGRAGEAAMSVFSVAAPSWLPWVLVALLGASALGLGDWLPRIPGVSRILGAANRASAAFAPTHRAAAMGAVTPLLPCGLLYGLFGSALVTGSMARGALLAGGFAMGGAPALLLAQFQTGWMQRLPKGSEFVLRRVVPMVAAVAIAIRASSTHGCPLCPQ